MAPPLSAYQMENFDPIPNEELICSICRCVFYDPVECPCRHVYCRTCITSWLTLRKTCPICRKRASISKLQVVVPIIKNMIMKLTIHCPNIDLGCKQKIHLESYDSHLAKCDYQKIQCKNTECKEERIRKEMFRHEQKECKFRRVKCHRNCSLMLPVSRIKSHSCVDELKKELKEKKNVIKELKNEIEDNKKQLQKVKDELKDLQNQNRSNFSSDEYDPLDSDHLTWSGLSDSNPDDSIVTDISDLDSTDENDSSIHSGSDRAENHSNFIDLVLMSLFPNSNNGREEEQQQNDAPANEIVSNVNTFIENLDETNRTDTTLSSTNEQLNSLSLTNMESANESCERIDVTPSQNRRSRTEWHEETVMSNEDGEFSEGNAQSFRETPSFVNTQGRASFSGEESPSESSDNTSEIARKRILKRKSTLPVLSDMSEGTENEPQRSMRRLTRSIAGSSEDEVNNVTHIDNTDNVTKSVPTKILRFNDPALRNSVSEVNCTRDSNIRAPRSRVPVPVPSKRQTRSLSGGIGDGIRGIEGNEDNQNSQNEDSASNSEILRSRQRITLSRIERRRNTRSMQSRVQRALELLDDIQSTPVENSQSNPPREWNTLRLLNRLVEDSDPDWEPPETDDDTDITISDEIESDSNYEVQIPERTWDLLERYSQEPSDDDSDWRPNDTALDT